MELSSFLYRAPAPTYTASTFQSEMIWIPGNKNTKIPCLFLQSHLGSARTFLYFHANAEDLGGIYNFLDLIRSVLDVNIIAPEYPGYGLYKGDCTSSQILSDALIIYKFICRTLKLSIRDIIIIGRSIGTGPASWLASQGAGALILLSPYTSIRKVVRGVFGKILQYIVKDQLKNIEYITKVTCPTLFIHGQKDSLISCKHSYKLAKMCKGTITVHTPEHMTHNEFQYYEDIVIPIEYFLRENNLDEYSMSPLKMPDEFFAQQEELDKSD